MPYSAATKQPKIFCSMALRRMLDGDVEFKLLQRHLEAKLRKGCRELFKEKLRPMLLNASSGNHLQDIRRLYAVTIDADDEKRELFDPLKYVAYSDFLRLGRLPSNSDGLTQQFEPIFRGTEENGVENREGNGVHLAGKSKPNPMSITWDLYLISSPRQDHSCINPEDPMPGVAALPVIIAQCDAVISLADDKYYDRAWCSVESLLAQTLKGPNDEHQWYEQVFQESDGEDPSGCWVFRKGPMDMNIDVAQKELTFEEDRPRVLFLERQSKLLW
ncbi:MAG: hypothetical protein Q9225_007895 [Loekoesia sp. 1 TL-2023]